MGKQISAKNLSIYQCICVIML